MRAQKVDPENVDQKLFELFSELGYDGASMELLAQATGLKKASLYHRFPDGKKGMALQALKIVEAWIQSNIVDLSLNNELKPEAKLSRAIKAVDQLYNGGANNCLLRTLSVGTDAAAFKGTVSGCFELLAEGFTNIAVELGLPPKDAAEKARQINLSIQGSLVLAGATGDRRYFEDTLDRIPALLTS
ncbi:TetR/AcrR family transcriptional regulator [Mucilaginibacter sp. CAU 1740]|uniref:TetR/AcrR family transcriptional regulator n=1 Tax=Mucilaginibacter sp. CAU 1740 TaxID=3140365 RepID=UPI00325C0123